MASIDPETTRQREPARPSYLPAMSPEEIRRRNRRAMELLDRWEREGDEQEQRETMEVLREALGEGRTL